VSGGEEGRSRRLDGVLFDYGDTLVEFTRPDSALAEAETEMLAVLRRSVATKVSIDVLRGVLDQVDR